MSLRSTGMTWRYGIFGVVFGLAFPLIATWVALSNPWHPSLSEALT